MTLAERNGPVVSAGQLAMAAGGGLIVAALLAHQSRGGLVLGRYSIGYALAVVAATAVWVALIFANVWRGRQIRALSARWLSAVPATWLDSFVLLVAAGVGELPSAP